MTRTKNHSEKTAVEIDEEIHRILRECYEEARRIVEEQRGEVEALAKALLRYESLSADEAAAVIRGDSVEAVRKAAEKRKRKAEGVADRPADGTEPADDDVDDLEKKGRFAY